MAKTEASPLQNRLLSRLPKAEYQRIAPDLQPVVFTPRKVIYKVSAPFDHVYFPEGGVVSAMTVMEDGNAIEVATIGKEGMVGLNALVGGKTSPYEVMVQVPGHGFQMNTEAFNGHANRHGPLRETLVLYHTAFSLQVSYAVACNGLHTVEKRCCRWLLMTQDRVGSNLLPLTHEFLAIMLGVRRASVTEVLRPLQERGFVNNGRGQIEILDRPGLESHACECYGAVNKEFGRLFG